MSMKPGEGLKKDGKSRFDGFFYLALHFCCVDGLGYGGDGMGIRRHGDMACKNCSCFSVYPRFSGIGLYFLQLKMVRPVLQDIFTGCFIY